MKSPLDSYQNASQSGESKELMLNKLAARLKDLLERCELVETTFLDIEGTFNNAILASLHEVPKNR